VSAWRSRSAWAAAVAAAVVLIAAPLVQIALDVSDGDVGLLIAVWAGGIAMCAVGALVASRTRNPLGWILIAIPATTGVSLLIGGVRDAAVQGSISLPPTVVSWLAWATDWPFFLSLCLLVAVFYLFPTGTVPSPRWRWPWRIYVIAVVVLIAGFMVLPRNVGPTETSIANPIGLDAIGSLLGEILAAAGSIVVLSAFAAFASLVFRYRGADAEGRQQLRWLFLVGAVGAILFVVLITIGIVTGDTEEGPAASVAGALLLLLVFDVVVGIPLATGVAIFRYHLYDLGIVVRKTLVFGLLAAFITAVYIAVVVGIGALIDDPRNIALSVTATVVVAILFQPARERVERLAARMVFGERATPYEVIAGFSERMSRSVSVDHVLPEMAEAAGTGVGALEATVGVSLSDGRELIERWVRDGADDVRASPARTIPISYHGEPVGRIDIAKPAAEPLSAAEEKLLADLAGQAGLALHNVRLTEELAQRVIELDAQAVALRASRERLVTARDAQRRGLQRDLHEGPERALIRIGQRLAAAAERPPDEAIAIVDAQLDEATSTLEGLRDLARGIFPPLLAEAGVVPALEAHIRKVGANAVVETADGVRGRRFDADLEACIYFCCLQTIQNVVRHAGNAPSTVHLSTDGDSIVVEIVDTGPGFDPGVASWGMGLAIVKDRVDALDGSLAISSADDGTQVRIRLPLASEVTAG
jgi:signal transduction histidine kinase